jgi:hypothetical protein
MKPCHELPLPPARRLHDGLWLAAGVLLVSALTIGMQVAVPWVLIALLGGPEMSPARRRLAAVAWLLAACALAGAAAAAPAAPLPGTLRDTACVWARPAANRRPASSPSRRSTRCGPTAPDKRRWLQIPAGTFIDASRPDAWVFPPGTRLWKEFSHGGRPVETRYIERTADGSWRFASYVWNEAGTDAVLAPARGIAALPAPAAPQGAMPCPRARIAWPATPARRCRCSASACCSSRPIATRWHPVAGHCARASSTCARWWRAAGCADCRRRWRRNRRA